MRPILTLLLVPALGCKSDEQRLADLKQEQGVACLTAANANPTAPRDSAYVKQIRCDLATRDLNRFMGGR